MPLWTARPPPANMAGFGAAPPSASANQPQLSTPIESILTKGWRGLSLVRVATPTDMLNLICEIAKPPNAALRQAGQEPSAGDAFEIRLRAERRVVKVRSVFIGESGRDETRYFFLWHIVGEVDEIAVWHLHDGHAITILGSPLGG